MKSLNIKLPKALLATIVSLGGLATVSAFGNVNRAVANEYMGESGSMSQEMMSSNYETIVGELSDRESFNTLARAVEAAGLADTLQNTGEYTVFAPTDQAFEALPPGTLEALLQPENQETLRRILLYHVVLGEADSSVISSGFFETAEGSGVDIDVARGMVEVEGATVVEADIQASNGVIHGIDEVILPPDISAAELQQLTAAQ
ncbi:fasciclin domain-containing protein [Capilliphycus salinus ALCB114379]|uniref:fasciclin domain-containing protein n=1 Tax=Capilliphycus salinus TaxID=2768948 RepID=UPI0039A46686